MADSTDIRETIKRKRERGRRERKGEGSNKER
jgi:hypothetical protein